MSAPRHNVVLLPLVLLVGASPELEKHCRTVAARAKLLLRSCSLPFARVEAMTNRPLAIVVSEELYALVPDGFERLAKDAGAIMVRLAAEPVAPVVLEYRLMGAVLTAAKLR